MKVLNVLISLVMIAVVAGCQSHQTQMTSRTPRVTPPVTQASVTPENAPIAEQASTHSGPQQIVTDDAIYTIEVIPNPRLSATSREGDKTSEVYSSNIIAVYRHPRNGATANSTNSTPAPSPEDNLQPQRR